MVIGVIDALNQLDAGAPSPPVVGSAQNLMQELALNRISLSCAEMGVPPSDMTAEVALRELQAFTAYGSEEPVALAPLDVGSLSLPPRGSRPVPLATLLGRNGDAVIRKFCDKMLLPSQLASASMRESGFRKPYVDP